MSAIQSFILGLVQGVTEFLPISSSGHLIVMPWLLKWQEHPFVFDILLHFATFCAIVVYFRKDWAMVFRQGAAVFTRRAPATSPENSLFLAIVVASIPAFIFGAIFAQNIETFFRQPIIVAFNLAFFGLLLYFSEKYGKKSDGLAQLGWQFAVLIGLAQILAMFPGVSRSGITISAALLLGLNKDSAVRFSFLMGAPILFGAMCFGFGGLKEASQVIPWQVMLAGFTAALLSSLAAIHFLLRFIKAHPFSIFVGYRLILAAVITLMVLL